MKLPIHVTSDRWQVARSTGATRPAVCCLAPVTRHPSRVRTGGFTLIEIAICLAIIGFALVAIIGVLPLGMNAQRANREETVINQDATVLINAIRNGSRGLDYLTNYVYAIVNTGNNPNGKVGYLNPTLAGKMNFPMALYPGFTWNYTLTSGSNIVGLLSTPEFTDPNGYPTNQSYYNASFNGISNHIVAYVRSISGLAAEKPPQDNDIMVGDTFAYRVYCANSPIPMTTGGYGDQLTANQRELRLTFLWPQLPSGKVGFGRQTYRATIAGQLNFATPFAPFGQWFYFYQPQFFTNAP
jgi:prepilin-type N-terminal cleavage/methylation domain-containing protein